MKKISFLLLFTFLYTLSLFSRETQEPDKDFESFIKNFATSSEFQYSRIKFPLITPIYLLDNEGNEFEIPFTVDEWPLIGTEELKEGTFPSEDGILFGQYIKENTNKIVFEAGLEESELDLSITFELIDGKWYVTDGYSAWYGGLRVDDLDATLFQVQQMNADFIERHP